MQSSWAGKRQNLAAEPVQRERRPWLPLPVEAAGSSLEGQLMGWVASSCVISGVNIGLARTSSCFHLIGENKLVVQVTVLI